MRSVAEVAKEELTNFFLHLAKRVERTVRRLPKDRISVKPVALGNSLG
jgi:hypothetical protein